MSTKGASKRAPARPLIQHKFLYRAVLSFIRDNSNFESSVPVQALIEKIGKCISLQEVFFLPIQSRLFDFDTSLLWIFFLTIAPQRAESDGDTLNEFAEFSCQDAMAVLPQVYDTGIESSVLCYFDADDDDEKES